MSEGLNKSNTSGDLKIDSLVPDLLQIWETLPFEKCIKQAPGIKHKLNKSEINVSGTIPVIDQGQSFITGYTDNIKYTYSVELPLIIFGDHTRHIKYVDFSFAVGADGTKIIVPNRFYDIKFFFYYLKSLNWQHAGYGRNYKYLKHIVVPLPPLNEQKRIVAKLDAIMPRIDGVKARLEKVPTIIKRFRQSVLTAAVTGRLTEKWREEHPEVESAEVLLERINKEKKVKKHKALNVVDENDKAYPLPLNWEWCNLSQIVLKMSTGPYGTMLHKSDYIENGIPVINPTNIKGGKLVASDKMMISDEKFSELSMYSLKEGNIVLARRGDLSKCGIVSKDEANWLCGTGSFFLEIAIQPIYFRFFYISDYCQAPLNAESIGSTMSNLNQTVLSKVAFPLPPLEEQKEIVRQVDKLFAMADKVEAQYKNAKAHVDKLSQSVLAKAFRGELVPQYPDDEPVEILLERIMEEKAKMESELKAAKTTKNSQTKMGK